MRVAVVLALPARQEVVEVDVPPEATLADALAAIRTHPAFAGVDWGKCRVGIWSRERARDTRLRDGDRVEIYRALVADPKAQRRARARLKPSPRSRNAP